MGTVLRCGCLWLPCAQPFSNNLGSRNSPFSSDRLDLTALHSRKCNVEFLGTVTRHEIDAIDSGQMEQLCGQCVETMGSLWAMWMVWSPHLALGVMRSLVVCVASEEQRTRRCGLDEGENAGYGVLSSPSHLFLRKLHPRSDSHVTQQISFVALRKLERACHKESRLCHICVRSRAYAALVDERKGYTATIQAIGYQGVTKQ